MEIVKRETKIEGKCETEGCMMSLINLLENYSKIEDSFVKIVSIKYHQIKEKNHVLKNME